MTQHTKPSGLSYRDAGVDIEAGDALVERIKPLARRTFRDGVLGGIGGFGALFEVPKRFQEPVLVSGTDGVGTKLRLAFELEGHATVGIDLVAMSVNDILVQGAEPLFFLDYFACGRLSVGVAAEVIGGIAKGCELAGCALIGGETAEMPGMYPEGEYDLAGFAVGVVEKSRILDGRNIVAGDRVLGLSSSGLHSNGYSLARRILADCQPDLNQMFGDRSLAQTLLQPTRIYVKSLLPLLQGSAQPEDRSQFGGLAGEPPHGSAPAYPVIKGLAHITGGGLVGNVPRILPQGLTAELHRDAWRMPEIFQWLQRNGGVADEEMLRVFNCGIGMVVVVAAQDAAWVADALHRAGETVTDLGVIRDMLPGEPGTVVV